MELMVKTNQPPDVMDPDKPAEPSAIPTRLQSFTDLMRVHHRELLVYARSIVNDHHAAQDIVQDSLVAAFDKFDQFEQSLDFGKWLRGIIRNKCFDWFRKQKRTPLPDTTLVEIELNLKTWQDARDADHPALFEALIDCIAQLPEGFKDAVIEFYLQENSGEETAQKLDISAAAVRKRLERARTQLHACLTGKTESTSTQ